MSFGAVIVNYNSAAMALDAALSVLGDDPSASVVIVDNCSTDDSLDFFARIRKSAAAPAPETPRGPHELIAFASLDDVTLGVAGDGADASITILPLERNGGFAAGCNAGMRYLAARFNPRRFLLLNPDAVICAGAMSAFAARLEDPQVGLVGATVLRFEAPQTIQALGGARLNRWTLVGDNIEAGRLPDILPDTDYVEARLDYPLGAAIALRADYREAIGELDERFFLYFEEADWARRGAARFNSAWARGAVVYHRHGAAAGSRIRSGGRSPLADFHMARSRVLYACKWRPAFAPFYAVLALAQGVVRLLRRRPGQAHAVICGGFSPFARAAKSGR